MWTMCCARNDALVRGVCAFEVAVNWFGTLIRSIKPGKVLCPGAGISDSAGGCVPGEVHFVRGNKPFCFCAR